MSLRLTAFERSPDRGRGLARDMRVRWALDEVGLAYEVLPLAFDDLRTPAHRARQPFGQIPTLEDDGLVLFESGAIVLHIAEQNRGLLPDEPRLRARAIMWMFAALNTVEPPIVERSMALLVEHDAPWQAARQPLLDDRVRRRLAELALALGEAEWLEAGFSAGDLMMVSVLQRLKGSGLLEEVPALSTYIARAEARPAFQRAFAAQLAEFRAVSPEA